MKKLICAVLAAAFAAGSLTGCSLPGKAAEPQRYSTVFYDVFDTVTTVIAYCGSEEEFTRQTDALHADLLEYNNLYDIYHNYDGLNNLKTINDNAGKAPVAVDAKILSMLQEAVKLYDTTNGQTNIAMGAVLNLWHDAREAGIADPDHAALPSDDTLHAAAQHCSITDVEIDAAAGTVYLKDPDMRLDVGSCGKGYACEMVAQAAEARGLTSALISVGGNLRAIGTKPDGTSWTGGVEDPWNAGTETYQNSSYLSAVYLTHNSAMVTSGDYQRYYTVDGVRYHHLIDPDTLYPAQYFDSVTVLCADSGLADCLSTGLFCMSLEDGQALVEKLDGVEAMWCLSDGKTIVKSSGWAAMEK
ncbi:MAG: FAD:protein FMN transferase [Faecalibacterium sp.]|jgi:thiamine biosynthesis lipoprotein|nr:FAD:protein FMN transferase [Faecalibacterium sp.]